MPTREATGPKGEAAATPEPDAFELFNRGLGHGRVDDLHPAFGAWQRRGPVHRVGPWAMVDDAAPPIAGAPDIYTVMSHELGAQVLLDHETFSSAFYAGTMGVSMGHTLLEMGEPEHGRHRNLLQKAFTRRELERWEASLVRPIVSAHVDRFAGRGRADLVRELTFPFPVAVIAGMIGLPQEELASFHRWAVEVLAIAFDRERGLEASRQLADRFTRLVRERRAAPGDDLVSLLAEAELDGARLSDGEILAFLRLLLPAGAETTYRSSSNLLLGLLTHPDQLAALRDDPALLAQAIEEGLRWEPPITAIPRLATRDVELAGVTIPKGGIVFVNLGAANRDPTRHADEHAFDIFRVPKQHLAFGFGPHRCLGMHLARLETRVALEVLLDRLSGLRLDPEAPDVHVTGLVMRAPDALPVRFDVV